jgi:ketosteroid isomerase-like protein
MRLTSNSAKAAAVAALLLAAASSPAEIPVDVREAIIGRTQGFTDAHITGDVAYINSCFTSDARVLGPGTDAVVGIDAISTLNQEWVDYGVQAFVETSVRMTQAGDFVIDEGTYFLRYGPDQQEEKGKYINIWTWRRGEWRLYSNMWNTNQDPS